MLLFSSVGLVFVPAIRIMFLAGLSVTVNGPEANGNNVPVGSAPALVLNITFSPGCILFKNVGNSEG